MEPKKNGAPASSYSETFYAAQSPSSPREEAEAEAERLRNRSESPAGRILFMEEQLEREQLRRHNERERWLQEQDAHMERMRQQSDQWHKERMAQLDHLKEVIRTVDQAVVSGFENLGRARQLAELKNEDPPPKMSNAEGFVEVGKAILTTIENLVGKVIERDPEARAKLQNLGRQALGMPPVDPDAVHPDQAEAAGEAAPAAIPAPAPSPAPAPQPSVVLGDVVAVLQGMNQDQIVQLAAQHGCAPEALPIEVLLAAGRKPGSTRGDG